LIFLTGKENMDETIEIKVTSEMAGKRLDVVLSEQCSDLTRSYINKLCKEERAALNGKTSKGTKKCKEGDVITLQVPEPTELEILPEEMNLDIVYEDQDVILINKPKGMVVHPAAGHYSGTLVNGLMAHCKDDLSGINGVLRPGIVHRIDKDTTGILIVCKNDMAHQSIAKQLYDHSITRKYHAIVYGNIKEEEGTVNAPIGRSLKDRKKMGIVMDGKHAVTHYKVLKRLKKGFTYIECQLETGRTHQIRVHMASIKHPLLGDDVYGPKKSKYTLEGQCLHAKVLGFVHPRTGEYMEFEVSLPEYFEKLLNKLDN
jgi:23S rRNA pseudouridine1911/1915/1917 synthase